MGSAQQYLGFKCADLLSHNSYRLRRFAPMAPVVVKSLLPPHHAHRDDAGCGGAGAGGVVEPLKQSHRMSRSASDGSSRRLDSSKSLTAAIAKTMLLEMLSPLSRPPLIR